MPKSKPKKPSNASMATPMTIMPFTSLRSENPSFFGAGVARFLRGFRPRVEVFFSSAIIVYKPLTFI